MNGGSALVWCRQQESHCCLAALVHARGVERANAPARTAKCQAITTTITTRPPSPLQYHDVDGMPLPQLCEDAESGRVSVMAKLALTWARFEAEA